jgi:hypothetical protein
MANLTAERLIGFSGPGYYRKSIPASAAITGLQRGASMITNASGKLVRQAGASGVFAGFCRVGGTFVADELIEVEIADRVVLPRSSTALTHMGSFAEAITDDETYVDKSSGAGGVTSAVTTDASRIGLIVAVEVGVSTTVDTRLRG